jgi:predicted metal-dependent phosphoesterase TrpH
MNSHFRVEFHCHTIYSKDSLTRPETLVATCRKKGIDRVVVTDHNSIQGGLKARELDPERVIVGEEIMTQKGELLAAFVQEEVPPGLAPEEAIRRLRAQQAFISVSHPFDHYRSGHWQYEDLEAIAPLVDAVEIFNARVYTHRHNDLAREFAAAHRLLGTAGSDAHAAFELGRATLVMPPFTDAQTFKDALSQARIDGNLSAPWVHLTSRYAVWVKKVFSVVK